MYTTEPFCVAFSQIKLAVSRKLCGAVIGQKGQTIRDFMQDSGATIRVQPLSELTPSDSERLITISGARDKVLRAVALILNTVSSCGLLLFYVRSAAVCSGNAPHPGLTVQRQIERRDDCLLQSRPSHDNYIASPHPGVL